ncbi:MAG: glycine cleavage system aminomethyltransferase GcvT [Thermoproteota archaeon]|nr:MAG: glycine cleavage system aminomethyltransferase GcvT [Candidatus Korarchaeota archaeon]
MSLETPLKDIQARMGAKFIEFVGWHLPVSYVSPLKEALAVRNYCGVFDVSHMGRFWIEGRDAVKLLQRATTNNMDVRPGRARYTLFLNENGGIKDDEVILRVREDAFLEVTNAATREKIFNWLSHLISKWKLDVRVKDITFETVMLAVQGPRAQEIIEPFIEEGLDLKRYRGREVIAFGSKASISRTGYTGEDGFEIIFWDIEKARNAFKTLVNEGVQPCGLAARDILRLEAGMCLYGNDIDENVTPIEARLEFAVKLEKGEFIGRDVLITQKEQGTEILRVGLLSRSRRAPRKGYLVIWKDEIVGHVTSGTFSPVVNRGIAMAYVPPELSKPGTQLIVKNKGEIAVEVAEMPFYDTTKYGLKRMR